MFVVSGVTGKTGSVVAQTLIDQGHKVRVLVRSAEKGARWKDQGAEVAVVELMDEAAMTVALKGARGAYFMLPLDFADDAFDAKCHRWAEAMAAAAKAAQLPHAVILSSVGAQHPDRIGPISTVHYLEQRFLEAAVPLTALRPSYFLENILEMVPVAVSDGVYPSMIQPLDYKIDMVATKDIGMVAVEALLDASAAPHRIIELKGADTYSATDVAAELSRGLGRSITPIAVPQETWVDQLTQAGLPPRPAASLAEMYESINSGRIGFLDHTARKARITLGEFVDALEL